MTVIKKIGDGCRPYFWPVTAVFVCLLGARFWWFYALHYGEKGWDSLLWYCDFFEGVWWLNVAVLIYAVFLAIMFIWYVTQIRPRIWHLLIYPIIALSILYIPIYSPVKTIVWGIFLHWWLIGCICVIGVFEIFALCYYCYSKRKYNAISEMNNGFVVRTADDSMEETGWGSFINTMFELVGKKQLEQESFAIGIAGKWGSGKTTFYDAVKRKIEEEQQFVLCEFKPWQILEPTRLASEFFIEFAESLTNGKDTKDRIIRKRIADYVNLLTVVPKVSDYALFVKYLFEVTDNESIVDARQKVEEELKDKQCYVIVMIDDLDRLNKEELLEIMRLVRASANFKRVLFILTYDKDYFARLLGQKIGVEYLEKIVNVEISLPPIELYKYGQLLYKSISSIVNEDVINDESVKDTIKQHLNDLDWIISRENSLEEKSLLYSILRNFRDIKRFSNYFGLVLRHLIDLGVLDQFFFYDLFWLEILHYVDEDTYNQLKNNYSDLLELSKISKGDQSILTLKKDVSDRQSQALLKMLFPNAVANRPSNSIIWSNRYYSYFALRQWDNYISPTEFKLLMNSTDKVAVKDMIKEWINDEHKRNSFKQMLKDFPQRLQFEIKEEADMYTYVLLLLLRAAKNDAMVDLIVNQFKHKYHKIYFQKLPNYSPKELIREEITHNPSPRFNKGLTAMCVEVDEPNSQVRQEIDYILSYAELKELAIFNYEIAFSHKNIPLSELFVSNSEYMKFIESASYVERLYDYDNHKERQYNNILGNYITEKLDKSLSLMKRLSAEELKKIILNLLEYAGVDFEHNESMAPNLVGDAINRTLGTKKNFEKLITKHFERNKEIVDKCDEIGLKII